MAAAWAASAEQGPGAQPGATPAFSIQTAHLDGSGLRTLHTDAYRQATHLRVSPDGQWIMFSRYHDRDPKDGLAKETWGGRNHYENTELVLMRADGSALRSLVPAKPGVAAVNSNWTDDGRGFVYVSTDNPARVPEIRRAWLDADMMLAAQATVALPAQLVPVDPHLHAGKLVFAAVDTRHRTRGIWIAQEDGSDARPLTWPRDPGTGALVHHPEAGDNDPRLSPDGTQVAFMRLSGAGVLWSIHVVDVASGRVRNLSRGQLAAGQMDAVPEWSGDGRRLIFWTTDFGRITMGLTTMRPDGSGRTAVLADDDQFRQSPAFFPATGSGPKARIVFSAWQVPGWKLWVARWLRWPG